VIPGHLAWGRRESSFVYGDPEFRAASDLARRIAQAGRVRGLLGASTGDLAATFPILVAVWRLPAVRVTVSRHAAAVWFSPNFPPVDRRLFDGRWAQAVLDLGPDDESYLAGRHKQALRTNMSHARQLGVQVNRVATYDGSTAPGCATSHRGHCDWGHPGAAILSAPSGLRSSQPGHHGAGTGSLKIPRSPGTFEEP
jgi:hypothetical protein